MSIKLLLAIIIITLALFFYTIGVWSEHHAGVLKKWHVVIFYCGLICDTIGTTLMESIAKSHTFTLNPTLLAIHGISGLAAILLMLFHAVWATVVIIKQNPEQLKKFHKFSIVVWSIWLIPYLIGMIIGMMH